MTFKDKSNIGATRPRAGTTSCTCRIFAPRSSRSPRHAETAVCNLAPSTSRATSDATASAFDFERLAAPCAGGPAARPGHRPQLLPDEAARAVEQEWRPVGLGVMGLQDVFFKLGLAFDSEAARALSKKINERSTIMRCSA